MTLLSCTSITRETYVFPKKLLDNAHFGMLYPLFKPQTQTFDVQIITNWKIFTYGLSKNFMVELLIDFFLNE